MPIYIALGNFSQQGASAVKGAPKRMESAVKQVDSLGGKIKDIYYVFGQYDFVGIFEFPNDEAMLNFSMRAGTEGNIRFVTLKAFPKDEAVRIIEGMT